jgi:hypothetical protein
MASFEGSIGRYWFNRIQVSQSSYAFFVRHLRKSTTEKYAKETGENSFDQGSAVAVSPWPLSPGNKGFRLDCPHVSPI